MKIVILITSILIILFGFSQTKKLTKTHIENSKIDTLKFLQGTWDFKYLMILGIKKLKSDYYATELIIKKERFIMNLSEAATDGKILTGDKFRFKFAADCGQYDESKSTWCNDMEIYKCSKKELLLLKRGQKAEIYFKEQRGPFEILLCYKKVK